ncbi:ABC transporter related protein [Richelia sinica FACHB-800]|uniref:ABC transporter related protein n=1 Tax=Richelia sinica FACHB-800 TaxID=1357546 RepID=A0A975T6J7_9NOST|nr:ABC transporter ATP-binding protein [Richelia sinica]MBD2666138.1 ABC transporter ATP-binding protein [Richelia sinica FACHB-800]QXE23133.1 ABC transporter related protein [Richelia sinica FACHB-800]
MSDTVIRVENLGKKYIIGHQQQERYTALRDVITNKVKSLGSLINPKAKRENSAFEEFWALKDVSFEIKQGDRVGIIGRNGAGKSTLLKILSRITEPTTGSIKIKGRVASLLEVGTGFHPELTGRENIFLNGAILGMSKAEIKRKFDEIVAFAEVEKFLDTPVKRYSSGMYVRLAFAVAAHLEPEILIVDEVLAVGDAQFQKKCLGKMEDVGKEGRTVLFVSHQMDMIRALCDKCCLLSSGKIIATGEPQKVIEDYQANLYHYESQAFFEIPENPEIGLQVIKGKIIDSQGNLQSIFDVFDEIIFEFYYIVFKPREGLLVNFEIKRNSTTLLLSFDTDADSAKLNTREKGIYKSTVKLPCPLLKSGKYSLSIKTGIANLAVFQQLDDILNFEVDLVSQDSSLLSYADKRPGLIAVPLHWNTEQISPSLNY